MTEKQKKAREKFLQKYYAAGGNSGTSGSSAQGATQQTETASGGSTDKQQAAKEKFLKLYNQYSEQFAITKSRKTGDSDVSSFLLDAKNYIRETSGRTGIASWSDVMDESKRSTRESVAGVMKSRSTQARSYLEENQSDIDVNRYQQLTSFLDNFDSLLDSQEKTYADLVSYYSQFDSDDAYQKYLSGWLDSEAETNAETAAKRQARYQSNATRVAELQSALHESNALSRAQALGRLPDEKRDARAKELQQLYGSSDEIEAEIARLEAENRQYERTQGVLDSYYTPVTDEFTEAASFRGYTNASREELEAYDASVTEGLTALSNGGTWDQDGNILNSKGEIVQSAEAPAVEDKLGMFLASSDNDIADAYNALAATNGEYNSDTWANLIQEGDVNGWKYLSNYEVQIYYYLYNTEGQAAAYEYLDNMATELTRRETQATTDYIDSTSGWEQAAWNIASVPMNVLGGLASFVDDASNILQGKDINPYSRAHSLQNAASDVRAKTAAEINEATGNAAIPLTGFTFGDVYQALMSAADSATGLALGSTGYGVLMGMGAASSEMKNLYDQGASLEQIAAGGVLAGAAEMVFEKYSIDKFVEMGDSKSVKDVIVNLLKQGGVEASEEVFTEIANTITNAIVMGSQSDWVDLETFVKNVVNAGLGGFISGGAMGGIGSTAGYVDYGNQAEKYGQEIIDGGGLDSIQKLAAEMSSGDGGANGKQIGKLAGKVSSEASARNVGKLADLMGETVDNQNTAEIQNALEEKGLEKDDAARVAKYLNKAVQGGTFTDAEAAEIEADDRIAEVYLNFVGATDSAVNTRTRRLAHALNGNISLQDASKKYGAQAEAMAKNYISGQDVAKYDAAFQLAFDMGKNGVKKEYAMSSEATSYLKEGQRALAWQIGVDAAALSAKSQGAQELDTEASYEGETVGIAQIASIGENGQMTLTLDDGRTVDSSEVEVSDGLATVYGAVTAMQGISTTDANMLVTGYSPAGGISAETYARGIESAFNAGRLKLPMKDVVKDADAAALTEGQRNAAYEAGRKAQKTRTEQAQARRKKKASAKKVAASKMESTTTDEKSSTVGKVQFDGDRAGLTEMQRASLDAMEVIADALGVQIHVFESQVGEDGKRLGSNGWYDLSDSSIHIDLHAGGNGEGTMLFTLAHELTHYIKEWSPKKFQILADFLMDEYGEKGVSVDALIGRQLKKASDNNRTISYDRAYEEVIADSMEAMLADGNVVEKLAKLKHQDETLWQKIKDFISDMVAKIRKAYAGLAPDSPEGRYVAEMKDAIERLQSLFTEALVDASENYQAAPEAEKNTTQEGGAKFQTRNVNGGQVVWIENSGFTNAQLRDPAAIAQYIAQHIGDVYRIIESGQKVYIGKNLPGEYTHSKYTSYLQKKKPALLNAKNKASSSLGEMIEIATNRRWEATKHTASKDAKYGMYRYDTKFAFPVKDQKGNVTTVKAYDAELLIRNASNGKKYLYDIVNIKEDTANAIDLRRKEARKGSYAAATQSSVSTQNVAQKTAEVNKKFSMRESVEHTKNLVALHNLTEDKLVKALELGGFPMPSIAITKADIPHTNFGDITLVFGSEVIDPKKSRKNVVYSADAWTPTFPRIEYEADDKIASKVHSRLSGLSKQVDEYFRRDLGRVTYDMEGILNRYDGEEGLIQYALDNYGLKAAYLEERGEHIQPQTRQEEVSQSISPETEDKYLRILDVLDIYTPEQVSSLILKDVRDQHGKELEEIYPGVTKSALRLGRVLNRIRAYLSGVGMGTEYKTVTDAAATNAAVDSKLDSGEYEAWVRELFRNIEKSRGVHNNKDRFTPSGNRRTFKQTHLPATLENIVKAMATQNGGSTKNVSGFNGIKTLRAGTAKRFRSIAEMHDYEGRLQNLTEDQLAEIQDQLSSRLYDIIKAIDEEGTQLGGSNSLIRYDSIGETLMEIAEGGRYNIADIQNRFTMYSKEISDELAAQVKELLFDVTQMPVNIFEAKPERAVLFNEIRTAILPKTTSKEVVDGLRSHGVPIQMYESGDNATRLDLVNSLEGVRFSDRDPEQQRVHEVLEKENAKLKEDVTYLKELLKLQRSVTGGKKFTKTSVEAAAGQLMKYAGARGTKAELVSLLNGFYEYIAAGEELTWEGVVEQAQPVVRWLQANKSIKKQTNEYAADILRELRGTRISLDDLQKKEVAYQYGSFNEFRKKAMGSIIVTNTGTPLDVQWIELSDSYPNIFDPETTSNDMPAALLDAISTLRDMPADDFYAYDREIEAQDLLHRIYDSYWNVSTLYTVADVKQREIDRLKLAHDHRIEKIREDHRKSRTKLKQQYRDDLKQVRKEMREGRKKTEMRRKIRKTIMELDKLLNKGDKKRNVKEGMQGLVAQTLKSADILFTDTYTDEDMVRNGVSTEVTEQEARYLEEARNIMEQIGKLPSGSYEAYQERQQAEANLKSQLNYRMSRLRDVFTRERARLGKATVSDVFGALADAYADLKSVEDEFVSDTFRDNVYQYLLMFKEDADGTLVKDMSLGQLEELHKAYTMVLTTVRNANKMFTENLKQSREELGTLTITEVRKAGKSKKFTNVMTNALDTFSWNNEKPVYAFERIGSPTLTRLFGNIRAGEDTWARDMADARAFLLAQTRLHKFDSWNFDKRHEFTSSSGTEFSLDLGQLMTLYAYSKREQAHEHLVKGGFVFEDTTEIVVEKEGMFKGIKQHMQLNDATAYNLSEELLGEITSKLTAEQKAFVDAMQDYLSATMGGKGNEVSLRLYGVKLFNDPHYLPLHSAGQFQERAKEANLQKEQGQISIVNSGFAKATTPKASNPVVLSGFMDLWADHVNEMSMYHAFVLPMEDFRRVYNYRSQALEGQAPVSVNSTIQNAYGKAATAYIDQLYRDLNGGAISDPRETPAKTMMGKFKKAAVMASLSVVIQQPSAIGRAFAIIDPTYFIGPRMDGKRHDALWEEVKKYAPVAAIKEMGYFDTGMGKSAHDFLLGKEYRTMKEKAVAVIADGNYRDEALGRLPALMDELTWCTIWEAAKRETKAKSPNLKVNSEEFLRKAGERFTEVVTKTQVYDSVLSRSANMRSKSALMSMATAFMAEPTTSINMVEDALRKAARGEKKHAARVLGAALASTLLNSLLASLVYAARDDDDETFWEKYTQSVAVEILDGLNPLTYYPWIKDVWSILQGYDVERSDMSLVSSLAEAATKLIQAYSKDTEDMDEQELEAHGQNICEAWWGVVDYVTALAGIPVKNVRRDINGAFNLVNTVAADLTDRDTTWASWIDKTEDSVKNSIPVVGWLPDETAADKLYEATVNGDTGYQKRLESSYDSTSALNSAISKGLRRNDPRIREAAIAYNDDELDEYLRIFEEILAEGNFSQTNIKSAIDTMADSLLPDEEASEPKEKSKFSAADFATAVSQGDADTASEAKADIIETAQKNGKTAEEAEVSFNSSAKTKLKEAYLGGKLAETKAKAALAEYCGMDQDEAEDTVAEWGFEAEYGFTYASRAQQFKDGVISAAELKDALMDTGGKTEEEASSAMVGYCRDGYEEGCFSRSEAAQMMVTYGGLTSSEAESKLRYIDFKIANPDVYADDAWIDEYYEEVQSSGISIDVFIEYRNTVKSMTGSDKKVQRMAVIDALPVSDDQKDALYFAENWAASKLYEAPWH